MNPSPILILQMQRMGDLLLSFPLLGWLGAVCPGRPLWVIGEQRFFEALMPLSPAATYFNFGSLPDLCGISFASVINLSHRREAAHIAGSVKAEQCLGPWLDKEGRLFINGDWQLYRASLTHNNRYNLYHWADLNALDSISSRSMLRMDWPPVRAPFPLSRGARVGLFLGASEAAKHPGAPFWASLSRLLLQAGHKPVLLGGEAELPLGNAVAAAIGAPSLNLCNRFDICSLARFIGELDLLVTPDTGPMHIAAWLGTPTLNLSLGPVNPWETGPLPPGHHIARPLLACAGCWSCRRKHLVCHTSLCPGSVAAVTLAILDGDLAREENFSASSAFRRRAGQIEILRSERESHGLYRLKTVFEQKNPQSREIFVRRELSLFWRAWFGALFHRFTTDEADAAWRRFSGLFPDEADALVRSAAAFALFLARNVLSSPTAMWDESDFWRKTSPLFRPLSGYIQLYAQNAGASRPALSHVLSLAEQVAGLRKA